MTLGQAIDRLREQQSRHGCKLVAWRERKNGRHVFTFSHGDDRAFRLQLPPRALTPEAMLDHLLAAATSRR